MHLVSDNSGRNVISFDTFEIAGRRKKEKERSKFVLNDQKSRKKELLKVPRRPGWPGDSGCATGQCSPQTTLGSS